MSSPSGAAARPAAPRAALLALLAMAAGSSVALLSVLGPALQVAVILGVVLGVPAMVLILTRPHLAIASYLFLLPLIIDAPVLAGLNGGELLTAGVVLLGGFSLWDAEVRGQLTTSLRALQPLLWPLLGLAIISVLSLMANGIGTFGEISSAVFKFTAFGAVAVLVHTYATTTGKLRVVLNGAVWGGFLVALYSLIAYLMGWSYSEIHDWNRASGTFAHWNQLGGFMVLMSVPTLGLAAARERIPVRLALALAFVLEIVALLLSLTLGSIVALMAGLTFGLVFLVRVGWRRLVAIGGLAVVAFGVVYATNPFLQEKLTLFPERAMDRLRTYSVGIAMFRDRFLLGFGSQENLLDQLWFGESNYGLTEFGAASSIPHNAFLLMGVEKGFLGVLFLCLLMGGALWILFRSRHALLRGRSALIYQGVVVGVLGFLVQNMTNNLVLHARIGIVFFALIALVDRMARLAGEEG